MVTISKDVELEVDDVEEFLNRCSESDTNQIKEHLGLPVSDPKNSYDKMKQDLIGKINRHLEDLPLTDIENLYYELKN